MFFDFICFFCKVKDMALFTVYIPDTLPHLYLPRLYLPHLHLPLFTFTPVFVTILGQNIFYREMKEIENQNEIK